MPFDLQSRSAKLCKIKLWNWNSYQSVPAVLLGFIKKYPNNASRSVVEKLLIDSYISSKL
jgi:hypothetical protein